MMRSIKYFVLLVFLLSVSACTVSQGTPDNSAISQTSAATNATGADSPFAVNTSSSDSSGTDASTQPSTDNSGSTPPPASGSSSTATDPLVITTAALDQWKQHADHSQQLKAKGGSNSYVWTATGLPDGLKIQNNKIKGTTAAAPAQYPVTITVKDTGTNETKQTTLQLEVVENIVEKIKIEAFTYDANAASWSQPLAVNSSSSNTIDSASMDATSKRLMLKVVKSDGTDASAKAYNWSVQSKNDVLGVFAVPSLTNIKESTATAAYLRPWGNMGPASLINMNYAKDGISDVVISVNDDFGNSATLNITSLKVELLPKEQEFLNGPLRLNIIPGDSDKDNPYEVRRSRVPGLTEKQSCADAGVVDDPDTDVDECAQFLATQDAWNQALANSDPSIVPNEANIISSIGRTIGTPITINFQIKGGVPPYTWAVPDAAGEHYYDKMPVKHEGNGWEGKHAGRSGDGWQGKELFHCDTKDKSSCRYTFQPIILCEYFPDCALPDGSPNEPDYLENMYRNPHTLRFAVKDSAGKVEDVTVTLLLTLTKQSCEERPRSNGQSGCDAPRASSDEPIWYNDNSFQSF